MSEIRSDMWRPAFCSHCGAALEAGVNFCAACGYNVAPPASAVASAQAALAPGQPSVCSNCGATLAAGQNSCLVCGHVVPLVRMSVAQSKAEAAAAIASRTTGQYSADGQWWWNGTQWLPAPDLNLDPVVPAQSEDLAVPVVAAPVVKHKRGVAKLVAPVLILASSFALGWFWWPYELLIGLTGVALATLAWWNPGGMGQSIKSMASKLKLPGMRPSRGGKAAAGLLVLSLVVFPVTAGAMGQYVRGQVADLPQQVSVWGNAFLSTPLTGANVNVYELGADGKTGTLLGTTITQSDNGYWSVDVSRHPQGTLLVATSGGSYVDEISKKPVTALPNDSLKTILIPELSFAQLTPLTTFAASRTVSMIASGTSATTSWVVAYSAVARQYNLDSSTLAFVIPTISNDPTDVLSTTRDARQEGLILAGLAQEAASLGTSEFALTDAIANDWSDGKLDGKQGATPILLDHGAALSADAGMGDLQKGIDAAAALSGFDNHIPAPQVLLQPINIALNGAGLFPATTALPAFVNTRVASVALEGVNGTKPYYCEPASGLPNGFSLSNSCVLRYDGADILGAGGGSSVLRMLPAFNVTMTDASSPKQSVTFSLTITVTQKPPEVTGVGGTCPQATKPCTLTLMSVKGGTPPYTYSKQCCDSLPLGMFIDLFKPILSGKPATAGTYTATVCATDLVGSQGCGPVTVVVEAGPSPTVPPQQPATAQPPTTTCIFLITYPAWLGGGTLVESLVTSADLCDSVIAQDSAAFTAAGYAMTRPDQPPRTKPVCRLPNVTIWGTGKVGLSAAQGLCAYYGGQ